MAITGLIIRLDIPELKQIVSLMRRTSANINRMAKHINQGDPVAVQQIDGLHEQQEEIWSGVRGSASTAEYAAILPLNYDILPIEQTIEIAEISKLHYGERYYVKMQEKKIRKQ